MTNLTEHIQAEGTYEDVVDQHDFLKVKGPSVLHEPWAQGCDKAEVRCNDESLWEW